MSDYTTSITDLYTQRSTLAQLQEENDLLLDRLAKGEGGKLKVQLQRLRTHISKTQQGINGSITQLYSDPLTDPLLQIEEANPILLFPVRMETRFANSGTELWIRVYPDEISIHTHETALTQSEINVGSYYWKYLWEHTGPDFAEHKEKAWSQVANRFGVNRAKWIFLKTQPLRLQPNEDFSNILTEADLDAGPIETKNQGWSEAAKSYTMPDLLKLRMYIAGNLVFETAGNPIVQPLPVSPDPKSTVSPAGLEWRDTEIAWMEDFDKAVEVGMAFKINLKAVKGYKPAEGFSSITVMGIRTLSEQSPLVVPPPEAGTQLLSTLFENHQYTPRGLALLSQGTPTNNTEEKKSEYSEQPAYSHERYLLDQQETSKYMNPDQMEDGKILALALGLDPALFEKLENSQNTDHKDAVLMNNALYPATLGFYLGHLLNPLFKAEELEILRSFFCSYVTGRGPIPVLRTGAQPYGILPTSNFKTFRWNGKDKNRILFQKLTDILTSLDGVYEAGIPGISKLGQPKDPHLLLDEILSLYPNSETFYQRVGYSENYLRNCLGQTVSQHPNPLLEQLIKKFSKYTGAAREGVLELEKIVLERTTLLLNRNKLVDVVATSETKTVSVPDVLSQFVNNGQNYIEWLAQSYIRQPSYAALEKDYFGGLDLVTMAPPLLYPLLKHGMLTQLYKCVFHWLSSHGFLAPGLSLFNNGISTSDFIASKEYLNFFRNQEDISAMELMLIKAPNLPFLSANETAVEYFLKNQNAILKAINVIFRNKTRPEIINDFKHLKDFFPTLNYLADLPTARLERTMIEHLDCLTYRLDAWQTALFYKKLEQNRSTGLVTGTVVGVYGWLENLRPASNITLMNEADLPKELQPGTGMPIITMDDHGGYIHAPSLTQAKAAALLRNAYLHYHNPADPDMMAVNLGSARVRKALEIYEGMQKGHSVNEILGYRIERFLHDQSTPLDKYIPVLRGNFPLGGKTLSNPGNNNQPSATQSSQPIEWVARLDGLAIVNAIKGGNDYPFGLSLPKNGPDADILREGITDLQDCIDAMKDLMVAESIHQMVQGNTDRAGALLKSIHELRPPVKFESIRTPRTPAEILTHRACIIFKPGDFNKPVNPWRSVGMSQRANTEPGLNEWLAEIIGAPESFQCTVTETKSRTNGIITIEDLNLQPIDLVYLAPAHADKEESELSRRIAYQYRQVQQLKEETEIEIDYTRAGKNSISIAELLPLLKLLKELITNSKALDASEFDLRQHAGKTNSRNLDTKKTVTNPIQVTDIGSLFERKKNLDTVLELLLKKLRKIYDNPATKCADIRKCLVECCDFDIRDAFPKSSTGENSTLKESLRVQTAGVISQVEKMVDLLRSYQNPNEEELLRAFALFFGPAFKVFPVFHFTGQENDEVERVAFVQEAYDAEKKLFSYITGKTNMSLDKYRQNWLNEIASLRPKLASFELTRLLYNSFQEKELDIHIMQLPYEANDSWLGLEFPDDLQTGNGKLSMLVHHFPQDSSPDWKEGFSGLLLDEWVEEIPGKEEVTGISFQYNQPDSQPPQTLLLAISPTEGGNWDWNTLSSIIDDTLRRAKQRAIGTKELAKTDWIGVLPGALAEFSATKANVSLFFRND